MTATHARTTAAASALARHVYEPAFVARVRLRAARRVGWLRHLWSSQAADGQEWLAISHAEVDRILAGPDELAAAEAAFRERDPTCRALQAPIRALDARVRTEQPWAGLCAGFALPREEADLAALAVAAGLDPQLARLYGYLLDGVAATPATTALARALFDWPPAVCISAEPRLLRCGLATLADGDADPTAPATGWLADPQLLQWIRADDARPDGFAAGVTLSATPVSKGTPLLYADALERMQRFVAAEGRVAPVAIELVAPRGSGKRTLAAQLAGTLGRGLLEVDAPALLGPDAALARVRPAAARIALTLGLCGPQVVYLHGLEGVDPLHEDALLAQVPTAVIGRERPTTRPAAGGMARLELELPPLDASRRARLWRALTAQPPPEALVELELKPAELREAALVAPAGARDALQRARAQLAVRPSDLLGRVPQPFVWDDLVLPTGVRAHLQEFESQARLRGAVYDEWGLASLSPLGRGITALFAGPTGTGKTMAAQVVSRELGLDLFRVDLSGVVNKYIGETEKRLRRVFDECERAPVLLFFDEADALFGQRTQVRDAHDRFANIEIDYLLQRMEQFNGVAVLATNRKDDLDRAFLRRLRFIVEFVPPGPDERLALWRLALPDRAPDGTPLLGRIDWELLAERLDMTGADIKAAALAAAFLARGDGSRIEMRHVVHAARRALARRGLEAGLDEESLV